MLSFTNFTASDSMKYVLYFVLAAFAVWIGYQIYQTYIKPHINKNSRLGTILQVSDLSQPSITGERQPGDPIDDTDFNYIHGTTFTVDGLAADPSNDVQKYRKSVDASGRAFWEPLPMTSVNDYLTAGEFNTIVDRQILNNMVPNLKYLTTAKFIRNADNFWGTYWPNENLGPLDNGRCVNPSDLEGKQGLYQGIPFGTAPKIQ
jgi:hypothetical protein